jgi:hypothetical protein
MSDLIFCNSLARVLDEFYQSVVTILCKSRRSPF